ncbi:MAG: hypothetical protein U0893_28165 [Chloroflexota bacterium]
MADLLYHLEMASLFAALSLGSSWTWLGLVLAVPVGGVVRAMTSRRTVLLYGLALIAMTATLDTVAVALDLSDDPDFAQPIWPGYFLGLVLTLAWVLRLGIGLATFYAGAWLTDRAITRRAARQAPAVSPAPPRPKRSRSGRRRRSGRR